MDTTSFEDNGGPLPPLVFSPEGEPDHSDSDAPIEATAAVREALEAVLKDLLETDEIDYDDDGDVPVRCGNALVYVRVQSDSPIVTAFAPLVFDIPHSTEALEAVNDLNQQIRFVRAAWEGQAVTLSADVPAVPFPTEVVVEAINAVGSLADRFIGQLQERLGGNVIFGDSIPAKHQPERGGYL